METKICPSCKITKFLDEFYKCTRRNHLDGVRGHCKECENKEFKVYQYGPARKTQLKRQSNYNLTKNYKLDETQRNEKFLAQKGLCDICGDKLTPGQGTQIDHDHSCCPGKITCGRCIRSLLCRSCNSMISRAKDDPNRLHSAALYLEKYRKQNV